MSENNGFPSMTALLGLLAVAGYQNRDKIAEWLGGLQGGQQPAGAPAGLDKVVGPAAGTATAGGLGGLLGGGLQELIERFQQGGRGDAADSWVRSGPNQQISDNDLEETIGPDVLAELERRTGLSRAELVSRLSRALPDAVDRYTPDGRLA
jgi:uncharacterized protein YidB (DUF937 family)